MLDIKYLEELYENSTQDENWRCYLVFDEDEEFGTEFAYVTTQFVHGETLDDIDSQVTCDALFIEEWHKYAPEIIEKLKKLELLKGKIQ
jgi:hypothetical protein